MAKNRTKREPSYAPKGSRVWVLVIKTTDGITASSAFHSWRTMENAVKRDWNERFALGRQDHEFGEAEKAVLRSQFFLNEGKDSYLVDECRVF